MRAIASHHRLAGFTLIELLVLLAIIGILLGIGYVGIINYVRKSQFNDAQQNLANTFSRARSASRKTSADQTITWDTSGSDLKVSVNNTLVTTIKNLKVLSAKTGANTVTKVVYAAPHGRLNTANTPLSNSVVLTIQAASLSGNVRLLGVTGKVVADAP